MDAVCSLTTLDMQGNQKNKMEKIGSSTSQLIVTSLLCVLRNVFLLPFKETSHLPVLNLSNANRTINKLCLFPYIFNIIIGTTELRATIFIEIKATLEKSKSSLIK